MRKPTCKQTIKYCLTIFFIVMGQTTYAQTLKTGFWRFLLENEAGGIPFNVEFTEKNKICKAYLINAKERIELETIVFSEKKDSIFIPLHVFDASLALKIGENKMSGVYRRHYAQTDQKLTAEYNEKYRFFQDKPTKIDFSGKWEMVFADNDGVQSPAIGVFEQNLKNGRLTGSILTPTGDYRYLEGNVKENKLYLSIFDGGFAYCFKASLENGKLLGEQWSATKQVSTWQGFRNEKAILPDADKITYLKKGYESIDFSFPNLEKQMVSPKDPKYQGKVLILQIFGSWCSNCMDETAFLSDWYNKNKTQPIAVIGLAYERKPDFEYAKQMLSKVVRRYKVSYDFLVAGTSDKEAASKTLPMLNGVLSYPTTIFIDKKGKIRKIHTGFSGPGTGKYYEQWREEFNKLINTLLKE